MTEPAFDDLARELQAARPHASDELRERVLTLARTEPVQQPRRFRLMPFLIPALGAATVVAAVAVGVTSLRDTGGGEDSAVVGAPYRAQDEEAAEEGAAESGRQSSPSTLDSLTATGGAAPAETLPPSGNRLQE